jgi:drug/metabolite transporter (DMT)-like permease
VFNNLRCEVVVHFVVIGGIVNWYYCINHIGGVMLSVLSSRAVDCVFEPISAISWQKVTF